MKNQPKKKILYIITQADWGGAQKYVYELATSRQANFFDISVAVGQSKDKTLIEKLKRAKIRIYQLQNLVRPISPVKDLKAIPELKKLYQQVQPDIIHLNSTKAGVIGSLAAKNKYKTIYTVHGWVFNEPLPAWRRQIYLALEKYTVKYKNKIICVSNYDQKIGLENNIPENKLITIYNGIKPVRLIDKEKARAILNLPHDQFTIGTIANFYKTKGLRYLIEAVNLLKPKVTAAVIGDGDLRPELENRIGNYNLKGHVLLPGRFKNASQYLSAYDIFVLPSIKEGFPYAILEAMSAGLPIIATNVGGVSEIIKDGQNGFLINPKNPEELATQIKHLMDNPEIAKKLAKQAEKDVIEKFSLDKAIAKTFSEYK